MRSASRAVERLQAPAFELVASRLERFRAIGPGRGMARCPAHKDRRASLSVREFDTGAVGLHCFAGCDVGAIVSALGLQLQDLFPPKPADPSAPPRRAERRPYSARQLIAALELELRVAWLLLGDIAAGKEISAADRRRAAVARERCLALMDELRNAH